MRILLPVGRSGYAIAAGYLGLFAVLMTPAPLALIFGLLAIWDICQSRGSSHPKHGMDRAIFGVVMGTLFSALLVVTIIAMAPK
jgi:membrane associated rhomboid family serine protease